MSSTCLYNQRYRLLEALKLAPVSTIQARHDLDIMQPATRIYELRHIYGFNISTQIETKTTPEGAAHKIAVYILLPGQFQK